MTSSADLSARLVALKQRFDSAFAEPPPPAAGEFEDLLVIALGAERRLLRLRDVEGLYLDRAITPVPSPLPHLLGVSDFRGELIAVYDLAAILGHARSEPTRYLARSPGRALGFAFERFDGHLRLTKQPGSQRGPSQQDLEAHAQAIVDLPTLVERLELQAARVSAGEA